MKLYTAIIVVLLLNILLPISSGSSEKGIGDETTLSNVLEDGNILAMNYWDAEDESLLCIVSLHTIKIENTSFPDRRLNFYKKIGDKLKKIYEFKPGDIFLSMYPLSDNGNLATVWVTGSAYRFYIFSFIDNGIKLVLDEGSKAMPEVVDIDNDGEDEILITEGAFLIEKDTKKIISRPKSVRVYKWDSKSYKLIKTVPWENRFTTLKKIN